jgi:hypothetical protein
MSKVTALEMAVITEKSGHSVTPLAVSVCTTPTAPSPLPIPYPVVAQSVEGIADAPMRTKINGALIATVGSVLKTCHGNEPGTLKEVVSLNTGGPVTILLGTPTVICELGMMGITGSMCLSNRAPSPGMGGSASAVGSAGGAGGGGGGPGGGPAGPGGPGGGGGSGGGGSPAPVPIVEQGRGGPMRGSFACEPTEEGDTMNEIEEEVMRAAANLGLSETQFRQCSASDATAASCMHCGRAPRFTRRFAVGHEARAAVATMTPLLNRYEVLSCWDRVVIQGTLPGLCFADGMTIEDFEAAQKLVDDVDVAKLHRALERFELGEWGRVSPFQILPETV